MKNNNKHDSELGLMDLKFFVEHNIFKSMKYLKKNSIYIVLIVALTGGVGYYLDKKQGEEELSISAVKSNGDRPTKRQIAISFNYNSMPLVDEWIAFYLHDEKWKKAGLIDIEIADFLPTIANRKEESQPETGTSSTTSKTGGEKVEQDFLSPHFHYYQLVVLAKEGFDFKSFSEDLTKRVEKIDHFSKMQTLHQAFLENRITEINQDLSKLSKLFDKEGISATDLIEVIKAKKTLEEELVTIKMIQLQTSSVLYEAYEINEMDVLEENMRYNPEVVPRKKIQFPLVGLVLFFLGQWIVTINRKYTKNNE
ncbi:hypothetical protein M2306_003022 [Myroides gitamensis]|uniref:hypothetical protein n=1 Tax=Myroides odoratus TaxID=256 RepID=UPI00216926A5|nr:hypothetical protein [Myroides odoratus]MCS4239291.1 hypothetical protein [Myroides odoratus]MDH6602328.1 hypothetical protein [Myroides gitamensis]